MFLFLIDEIKKMPSLTIDSLIVELEKDNIFNQLAAYAEKTQLHEYENCPHCKGELTPLPMQMSQAFCGYLPASRALYHECANCGLVVMSPYVDGKNTSLLYDIYDKQDFVVTHTNPYQKGTPRCDFSQFFSKLPKTTRTLDLGGGMGGFSKFLKENHPAWEITHSDFAIKQNIDIEKYDIETKAIDFLNEPINGTYDLISAWEVLEHIPYEKLEYALNNIYNALSKGGVFVFSTPDFDSPLCKSNDFYAACPPFHYLVFGQKWIKSYFAEDSKWDLLPLRSMSDFLSDAEMWYDYAQNTAPSFQLRATANILKVLLGNSDDNSIKNRQLLIDNNIGTEIIVTLVKK